MRLFIDASALVSIVAREADFRQFATRVADATEVLWSAMSCWEAISALRRSHGMAIEDAREKVATTAEYGAFTLVSIGAAELEIALDAYSAYGRGRHKAQLNFGDCFAYACAKTNEATLLYKGNDFALTDLA